jgi:hypothetical protein
MAERKLRHRETKKKKIEGRKERKEEKMANRGKNVSDKLQCKTQVVFIR